MSSWQIKNRQGAGTRGAYPTGLLGCWTEEWTSKVLISFSLLWLAATALGVVLVGGGGSQSNRYAIVLTGGHHL